VASLHRDDSPHAAAASRVMTGGAALEGESITIDDRRRPDRIEMSVHLLPLLRSPAGPLPQAQDLPNLVPAIALDENATHTQDRLATARGILLGTSISLVFWAMAIIGARHIFSR
jgi:hypothetical protein